MMHGHYIDAEPFPVLEVEQSIANRVKDFLEGVIEVLRWDGNFKVGSRWIVALYGLKACFRESNANHALQFCKSVSDTRAPFVNCGHERGNLSPIVLT